jgi:Nuclear transport factor 2 (NTF2) domain
MAEQEQVAVAFVQFFYQSLTTPTVPRTTLEALYNSESVVSIDGETSQGRVAISERLKLRRDEGLVSYISTMDAQPLGEAEKDGKSMIVLVGGSLRDPAAAVETEAPSLQFSEVFTLVAGAPPDNDAPAATATPFFVRNQVFRTIDPDALVDMNAGFQTKSARKT